MQTLIDLLHACPNNAPLLLSTNGCFNPLNKSADPLCSLIDIAFSFAKQKATRDRRPLKTTISLIASFLEHWPARKHHYEAVFQHLSNCCSHERGGINCEGIFIGLKLLRKMSADIQEEPQVPSYFYFFPVNSTISLSAPSPLRWEFSQVKQMLLI